MYPFERFSDAAKVALTESQVEAERGGHHWIGTEHLLLGLMASQGGLAAQALSALGMAAPTVRERLMAALGRGEPDPKQIVPTSRVKKVIELAFEESRRGQRKEVTTGDLLLAMLTEGQGLAAQVLHDLGVREGDVRAELARLNVAGVKESGGRDANLLRRGTLAHEMGSFGEGARVLVHDPEPPHRLWEGRVIGVDNDAFVIAVEDRPAGASLTVGIALIHPVPTGPTFMCRYCQAHL